VTANQGDGTSGGPVGGHRAPFGQVAPVEIVGPDRDDDVRPSVASRLLSVVLALVVGIVYGAVGTVAHPLSLAIGSATIPWGLIVALVGLLALFVGLRLVLGERLAVIAAAVGVVGIVSLFSLESAGGSVLIQEGVVGLVWVVTPVVLAALVIFWPSRRSKRRRTGSPTAGDRLEQPDVKEFHTP
jgi:hypothetical protein